MTPVSVRYGFATNSSSLHSLVHGAPSWAGLTKDEIVEQFNPSYAENEYGWSKEEYSSLDDVVMYCLLNHFSRLYSQASKPFIEEGDFYAKYTPQSHEFIVLSMILEDSTKNLLLKAGKYFTDGYIDHQSITGSGNEEEFWNDVYGITEIETGNDNN